MCSVHIGNTVYIYSNTVRGAYNSMLHLYSLFSSGVMCLKGPLRVHDHSYSILVIT